MNDLPATRLYYRSTTLSLFVIQLEAGQGVIVLVDRYVISRSLRVLRCRVGDRACLHSPVSASCQLCVNSILCDAGVDFSCDPDQGRRVKFDCSVSFDWSHAEGVSALTMLVVCLCSEATDCDIMGV
ncbi:hypothetical protein M758_3G104100 [Ceratodon purpureus]|nr:hypothetical protein M758_3G104100 [Ceratodon purpureus]